MGDVTNEPSMEEILSSIKRIIAEDGDRAGARTRELPRRKRQAIESALDAPEAAALPEAEEVLELTETVEEEEAVSMAQTPESPSGPQAEPTPAEIVSENVLAASRRRIESLSAMVVKPESGPETLEGLVREMLRPMLKEWLDANLPDLVERVVAREISRISGKAY